jgi:hypothetical protein
MPVHPVRGSLAEANFDKLPVHLQLTAHVHILAECREIRVTYQLMTTPIDGSEEPIFDPRDDMLGTYTEFFSALCGPETSMIRTPALAWILDQVRQETHICFLHSSAFKTSRHFRSQFLMFESRKTHRHAFGC